ncbi:Brix-domain-containing protein [Eremomyces bilateralis CBS 781.70]|uniref:Brix-domain-containing protein n=1 Tax=Eremomyces bilateralis CBS 781.70 TaxID=1392243 RepID=A0A6G1G482_9PEZI|nr:Brix-domain-containing protein [Eremomyces bilateralis CBS 781.70]KAF1812792.1 Brix-domain-containing protein [Eremomyces bilateralis CBS 781.70]
MARRRVKKRTQARNVQDQSGRNIERTPKSMVLRIGAGEVGPSISQLAQDVRSVMEPETASRLRERKANKLRDYTTMCGPLGVTHLILFSRSPAGNTNLRIAITPRGPTLHFRVDNYSLCKDIMKAMRHPKNDTNLYKSPPLLVMNNFMSPQTTKKGSKESSEGQPKGVPKHLEQLCTTVFQSLFPPITPQTTPLSSIKRVLLLNREPNSPSTDPQTSHDESDNPSYILTFRHFAITTKTASASRAVKRLKSAAKKGAAAAPTGAGKKKGRSVPNLGSLPDVSDWVLHGDDPGSYTSASESEPDTDAEVEVGVMEKRAFPNRNARVAEDGESGAKKPSRPAQNSRVEKRAVKLIEIGPRMRMRLVKVEDGVCSGKVMWHEFVDKSPEEVKKQEKEWERRTAQKDARRKEQRDNIEKKRMEKKPNETAEEGDEMENEYDTDEIEDLDDEDLDEMAYEDVSDDDELVDADGVEDEEMEDADE